MKNTQTIPKCPLRNTYFQWSCFDKEINFLPWHSEYLTAEAAEEGVTTANDGTAFDTDRLLYKAIAGIYLLCVEDSYAFSVDTWDKDRSNLVGCVTVTDWEWDRLKQRGRERYVYEDTVDGPYVFSYGDFVKYVQAEATQLSQWYNTIKAAQKEKTQCKSTEEALTNLKLVNPHPVVGIESDYAMLDMYYAWRALEAIYNNLHSGAEIYDSAKEIRKRINILMADILMSMEVAVSDEDDGDIIPEDAVIDYINNAKK